MVPFDPTRDIKPFFQKFLDVDLVIDKWEDYGRTITSTTSDQQLDKTPLDVTPK